MKQDVSFQAKNISKDFYDCMIWKKKNSIDNSSESKADVQRKTWERMKEWKNERE